MFTLFESASTGHWQADSIAVLRGPGIASCEALTIRQAPDMPPRGSPWPLVGVASHARYVERDERAALAAVQSPLGRPEATRAVLIPIQKSPEWWALAQDERRAIFEPRSRHISGSLPFLPAIARQLYHSRDLGEPFDFLTWFEFAPRDESLFDQLLASLRGTDEWTYVTREVELRFTRVNTKEHLS